MSTFRIRQEGDFWVPDHEELAAESWRIPVFTSAAVEEIRAQLWHIANAASPGIYTLDPSIEELRQLCFAKIDARSSARINAGFVFDGVLFSMSASAQQRYAAMEMKVDKLHAAGAFPLPINSLDDTEVLALRDKEHLLAFCDGPFFHTLHIVGEGTYFKQMIRDSEDPAFIASFEDPRPLSGPWP